MVSSARSCCNVKHAKCRRCVLWCPLPDRVVMLKLNFIEYPAIHTNYS